MVRSLKNQIEKLNRKEKKKNFQGERMHSTCTHWLVGIDVRNDWNGTKKKVFTKASIMTGISSLYHLIWFSDFHSQGKKMTAKVKDDNSLKKTELLLLSCCFNDITVNI